jgi:nitrogen fixation protein FixH
MVEIRDRGGAAVSGLTLHGMLERPATEAGRHVLAFREAAPGVYLAEAGALSGTWDLTAVATDGAGRRFEAERRLSWP